MMIHGAAADEPARCETAAAVAGPDGSVAGRLEGPGRVVEVAIALALLIVTAPVILVALALVRLTSKGPAIYRQVRVGLDGVPFTIYKIRSMYQDSERGGPRWARVNDPRVTPVGAILRRTHIDELPQLWNVLRGDMSLIGPRPERPEFVAQLERVIPGYRGRLRVRPGVTGLAQVQLPPDTDLAGVQRKLTCDLYYVERRNLWLDVRIILATVTKVLGVPCGLACQVLGIPTEAEIQRSGSDPTTRYGIDYPMVVDSA